MNREGWHTLQNLCRSSMNRRQLTLLGLCLGGQGSHALSQPVATIESASGRVLRVGPRQDLKSVAAASHVARDGDTVEIEAGTYDADVAVWTQDALTLRSVGGPVRLRAAGADAEGKGIWVLRGGRVLIDGIDFTGARVRDQNGAGIKFERGQLSVRHCRFIDNQMGILTAGAGLKLDVQACEFGHSAPSERFTHQLYAGALDSLRVTACYFHHGRNGHLLKSRAQHSLVQYCRLTDEAGGKASYEVEFPNGGVATVLGNVIQQSETTENPCMLSFGAEGLRQGGRHELRLSHNTLINDLSSAADLFMIDQGADIVVVVNNIFSSDAMRRPEYAAFQWINNFLVDESVFVDAKSMNYQLRLDQRERLAAKFFESSGGLSLVPEFQYRHPMALQKIISMPRVAGAIQV